MESDDDIRGALRERILLLDGATGTMLLPYSGGDSVDRLNETAPDIVAGLHRAYLAAGADIIKTNTFNGLSRETARTGARIAREAARAARRSRPVWVAGSIGPAVPDPEGQIAGLVEGGADLLLVETCCDIRRTEHILAAARCIAPDIPVIVSVTPLDPTGRTLSGLLPEAFRSAARTGSLLAFGLNCFPATEDYRPLVRRTALSGDAPFCCCPNAGLPDAAGRHPVTPEQFASFFETVWEERPAGIAGGCCGTTPAHVAALNANLAAREAYFRKTKKTASTRQTKAAR